MSHPPTLQIIGESIRELDRLIQTLGDAHEDIAALVRRREIAQLEYDEALYFCAVPPKSAFETEAGMASYAAAKDAELRRIVGRMCALRPEHPMCRN